MVADRPVPDGRRYISICREAAVDEAAGACLAGERLAVGDIALGCGVWRWMALPIERPALPNLQRWFYALFAAAGVQEGRDAAELTQCAPSLALLPLRDRIPKVDEP